jgi:GGDEF domain-containing protein
MIAIAIQAGFHRFEWSHKRYDGLIVPVEVMLRPVIVDGELILHTVWRDITERIRADAAMYQAKEAGRNSIRFYDSKK